MMTYIMFFYYNYIGGIMDDLFKRLSYSKFRSSFKLKDKDILYINSKGIDKIREHAYDFVIKRLRVRLINDGKQTPMKGHPVFIAMHATGTCCRRCLRKWHSIDENKILDEKEIDYIVSVIMRWIDLNNTL